MKLAIFGITGRMGLAIARLAHAASDVELVGGICSSDDPGVGKDIGELAGLGQIGVVTTPDIASGLLGAEVVIDFSTASAVAGLVNLAARQKIAVVSGTTNIDENAQKAFDKAAQSVPVLWAPNMSLGVQVLAELVEQAVKRLGLGYDVEITEIHHRKKVDSPSGTAKRLADAARSARPELHDLHGRSGDVGARTKDEMAVLGIRGGDVVGDHTVYLFGQGERLELTHRASNRDLFAHGAIAAARFVAGKPAKRYTIADVLG
ncbi:MAG: 4-hydroxy-tetrahydrodipicolinate reductase [Polyangiaceae bacterium]|jgi:4-hydroxy-tetrahydrodipicolinate reductase|nr:4-hydroxy-tetrahydrodipicolinate reductase [Polyangiaceae bacterium]